MKQSPVISIRRTDFPGLIVFAAVLLGAFMRFLPTITAGYPVGDGGMFAVMVEDLRESRYRLPEFTTYNHADIPFAYPPLGFYAGRIAADLFDLTSIQALRWVPALFASLSILAFYALARRLFKDQTQAAAAVLFFAMMPRALSWFVSGGGLTRSPGQFFMLLTIGAILRLFQEKRRSEVFWAGLFAGLTIMSHPEAAIHMISSVILFWVVLSRSRTGFLHLVGAGGIAFMVSAPWWGTVIHYHGLGPLLSAVQTGQKSLAALNLISFDFTEEVFATLIAVLGLLGLVYSLVRRDLLLPLWLIIPFIVEGRSAVLPAAIPLAMLAAIGLVDVVFPSLLSGVGKATDERDRLSGVELGVFVYLLLFLTISTYQFGSQLAGSTLSRLDREAMNWVRQNTGADSRFLVLTGTNAITCDLVLEWFPALTERRSIFTVQGAEWLLGADFAPYVRSTYGVQSCLTDGDLACLDRQAPRSEYDYLYVSRFPYRDCKTIDFKNAVQTFLESLSRDPQFREAYRSEQVVIFAK